MIVKLGLRVGVVFVLLVLGGCSKPPPENKLQTFQGEWEVVVFDRAGEKKTEAELKQMSATIQKDLFKLTEARTEKIGEATIIKKEVLEESLMQVDSSKTPADIDLVSRQRETQGQTRKGIYQLEDDQFKLCLSEHGGTRPTGFAGTEDPVTTLIVLQRKK